MVEQIPLESTKKKACLCVTPKVLCAIGSALAASYVLFCLVLFSATRGGPREMYDKIL